MSNNATTAATSTIPNWFMQFYGFAYEPSAGLQANFIRLASARKWGYALKNKRWAECQATQFSVYHGTNTTKLEIWQTLCHDVGIKKIPSSITKCKKVLGSRHVLVNLVNLIDHRMTGAAVIRFPYYSAFWKYTSQGRRYPLDLAKQDGFIKTLLRKL